jgi:hypothetical protein
MSTCGAEVPPNLGENLRLIRAVDEAHRAVHSLHFLLH